MALASVLASVQTKRDAAAQTYSAPDIHQMSFTANDLDNRGVSSPDANNNYYAWLGGNPVGIQGDGDDNTSTHRNLVIDTTADALDPYTNEQIALRCNYLVNSSFSLNALQLALGTRYQEIYYRVMVKLEAGYVTPFIQHKFHKFYEAGGSGNDANTFTGRCNATQGVRNGALELGPHLWPITQYGPGQAELVHAQYTASPNANRVNDDYNNKSGVNGEDWNVIYPINDWFELIFHHVFDPSAGTGGMQEAWLNGRKMQKAVNIINCGGTLYPYMLEWFHEKDFTQGQIDAGDDAPKKMWLKKHDISTKPIEPLITKGWDWL